MGDAPPDDQKRGTQGAIRSEYKFIHVGYILCTDSYDVYCGPVDVE
jgi:hypothetical protein